MDRDIQLIKAWKDTPAQGHDSQALEAVLLSPEIGEAEILPDSAYWSAEKKIKKLYLAAFRFLKIKSNWYAITTLANHILAVDKNSIYFNEIDTVLNLRVVVYGLYSNFKKN
ncbi:MAG: hypothetical protein ABIR84_04165 [Candidatus Nitrotoga sp.]